MLDHDGCRTAQFSLRVLEAVRSVSAARSRMSTAEAAGLAGLMRPIADAAGGGRHRLVVAMVMQDSSGRAFDSPQAGTGTVMTPVPPGGFPFGGEVPPDERLLLVTVRGEDPRTASVRVDRFENGLHQGILEHGPAVAVCPGDAGHASSYAHLGVDVTDLVTMPVRSVQDLDAGRRGWVSSELFPGPHHSAVVELGAAAEDRGEAVVVQAAMHPGLNAVRSPGDTAYRLTDDRGLALALDGWSRQGVPVNVVRQAGGAGADECTLVRKVSGVLHGPTADAPAVCVSRVGADGGNAAVETRCFDRGRGLEQSVPHRIAAALGLRRPG